MNTITIFFIVKKAIKLRRILIENDKAKIKEKEKDKADLTALQSLYEITLETRNFEISQLVQRNNFFMIFQGVVFAGVIQSSHGKPLVSLSICLAGLLVSILQVGMAAGAKYWQDAWQQQLLQIEEKLKEAIEKSGLRGEPLEMFTIDSQIIKDKVDKQLGDKSIFIKPLILKKFSVSRIPIYIALSLTSIWVLLLIGTVKITWLPFSINLTGL